MLPQVRNQDYRNFYRKRGEAGDFIILDNGAYENQVNGNQLHRAIEWYQPDVVVLPDYLLEDWNKTWSSAQRFLDSHFYNYPSVDWGYVPQAVPGDIMGWAEGLVKALEDARIKWLLLPRALGTHIVRDPFVRANICRFIKRRGKRVHALGMLDGSVAELAFLRDAGCDSVDSSAPVWRGWNGVALGHPWKDIPADFEATELDPKNDQLIIQNLEQVGVNCTSICQTKKQLTGEPQLMEKERLH